MLAFLLIWCPHVVPVDLDSIASFPAVQDSAAYVASQPHNPAFVVFTSGSTGKPKVCANPLSEYGAFLGAELSKHILRAASRARLLA